jgi:UDP-N-acetylmuramyl tripeptide synthase
VRTEPGGATQATLGIAGHDVLIKLPLVGLYNSYNALAAAAICHSIGLDERHVPDAIQGFTAVFGRQETVRVGDGLITLTLVKNPVGFNQVLQTLPNVKSYAPDERGHASPERPTLVVVAINDLFADGTDVSWLWDVDFETIADAPFTFLCSGTRAHDMALRLKYAGIDAQRIEVQPDLDRAIDASVLAAREGSHVSILPTYTAMLTMRAALQRSGLVPPFWED